MVKVLVVDDGDIGRLGRTAALEAAGHQVTAASWSEVEGPTGVEVGPDRPDVLVAVLHPDTANWDRYGVLGTVSALTGSLGSEALVVGLLPHDAVHNPLLAVRLDRAGVARVAADASVRTVDDIDALVTGGGTTRATTPNGTDLALSGVSAGTDPEAVVEWVLDRLAGPHAEAYERAFDPRCTQSACGLTRRQAHNLRVRLSALGRIRPSRSHSGGGPVQDRSLPRWNEVVAVANLCRGVDLREGAVGREVVGGQAYTWRAA